MWRRNILVLIKDFTQILIELYRTRFFFIKHIIKAANREGMTEFLITIKLKEKKINKGFVILSSLEQTRVSLAVILSSYKKNDIKENRVKIGQVFFELTAETTTTRDNKRM